MQSALVLHPTYWVRHVVKIIKLQASWDLEMTLNLWNLCFWLTQGLEKRHSCIKYRFIRFCLLNNQAGWVFNRICMCDNQVWSCYDPSIEKSVGRLINMHGWWQVPFILQYLFKFILEKRCSKYIQYLIHSKKNIVEVICTNLIIMNWCVFVLWTVSCRQDNNSYGNFFPRFRFAGELVFIFPCGSYYDVRNEDLKIDHICYLKFSVVTKLL